MKHRVPVRPVRSDPVDERYQREVDASTDRAVRAYDRAVGALEAAEALLERRAREAARKGAKAQQRRAYEDALAVVELRRLELEKLYRLMQASPQSAAHRGRKSFGPKPPPGSVV
jgi:rhamnose utilization protein RhaD (predicted bifunctional aldolase and dehydrogenase)